jgi:uncharacterized protein (TIGR03437 family)
MISFRLLAAFAIPLAAASAALNYASYLGGSGADTGVAVAVDSAGNTIVAGTTLSSDFPVTSGAYQRTVIKSISSAGFVEKLDPTGSVVLFATYLAGSSDTTVTGMTLDAKGNIVVVGYTTTGGTFPTSANAVTSPRANGFVAKLSAAGDQLLFAAAVGAYPMAVALDASGAIYVTGAAFGGLQTTAGVVQPASGGGSCTDTPSGSGTCADAFVLKLSADASTLLYATYLGGSAEDTGRAIAVDAAGNAYITGDTASGNFPLSHAAQAAFGGRIQVFGGDAYGDAFVAKLDPAAATLVYSTYLGGSAPDIGYGIAVDASGYAYVAGATSSPDFRTTGGAWQRGYAGPTPDPTAPTAEGDAFVTVFSAQGAILWSTLLGGASYDSAAAIALDRSGNVYVAGSSGSADFPVSANSVPSCRRTTGPFVAELDPAGARLLEATWMSGMGFDQAGALALDSAGSVYVTGSTASRVFFASPAAAQKTYGGGDSDAFLGKLNLAAALGTYVACVLNAASFLPGNESFFPLGTVAPGEIVSVFGTGLGPNGTAAFDGLPAPVTYSGSNQLNVIVPYGINAAGPTRVTVQQGGASCGPVVLPVDTSVPGIFTYDGSGIGHAAVLNEDGTYNTTGNPAQRGHIITFYATGAGRMNPPVQDGTIASTTIAPSQQPVPQQAVSVTIRGTPAQVLYAGAAPAYIAGLIQVNVVVPTTINFGSNVPLVLTIGNNTSQYEVSVAVQ